MDLPKAFTYPIIEFQENCQQLTARGVWMHSNLERNTPPNLIRPMNCMFPCIATVLPGILRSTPPS